MGIRTKSPETGFVGRVTCWTSHGLLRMEVGGRGTPWVIATMEQSIIRQSFSQCFTVLTNGIDDHLETQNLEFRAVAWEDRSSWESMRPVVQKSFAYTQLGANERTNPITGDTSVTDRSERRSFKPRTPHIPWQLMPEGMASNNTGYSGCPTQK